MDASVPGSKPNSLLRAPRAGRRKACPLSSDTALQAPVSARPAWRCARPCGEATEREAEVPQCTGPTAGQQPGRALTAVTSLRKAAARTGRPTCCPSWVHSPSLAAPRPLGPPIGWGPGVRGQGREAAKQAGSSPGPSVPRGSKGSGWKTEARFPEPVPPPVGNPEGLHSGGGTGRAQILPRGQ